MYCVLTHGANRTTAVSLVIAVHPHLALMEVEGVAVVLVMRRRCPVVADYALVVPRAYVISARSGEEYRFSVWTDEHPTIRCVFVLGNLDRSAVVYQLIHLIQGWC